MRWLIRRIAVVCVALMLATQVFADSDPGPRNNYGRDKLGGMKGAIKWESLLHGDGLDGWRDTQGEQYPDAWTRDGNAIVGQISGKKYGRLVQGDQSWKNYVLSVKGTLEEGSNLQIAFRVSEDGKSNYFLDFLTGWRSVAITKKEAGKPGVTKLDVVNFPIEYGREYDITIAVRGQCNHQLHRRCHGQPPDRRHILLGRRWIPYVAYDHSKVRGSANPTLSLVGGESLKSRPTLTDHLSRGATQWKNSSTICTERARRRTGEA